MSELARFQVAFAQALGGDCALLAPWIAEPEPRLAVYRNTVAKGCADAIAAPFPTLLRVVGEAWLRDAAVAFSRAHPPAVASLVAYGEAFPDWLAAFPPAIETPWLASLARIDWARRDALFALDRPPLGAAAFAGLGPEAYESLAAELHPAARALWFGDGAPSLWRALQADPPPGEFALSGEPEGLLVTRPALEVRALPLSRGGYAFLAACGAGESLAAAGATALSAEPGLALADVFSHLIGVGAFGGLRTLRSDVS